MDFLCSNLVKTIFTYWIGTVFNLILQLADYYGYLFNEEKLEAKKILDFFERHGMESITAYIAF